MAALLVNQDVAAFRALPCPVLSYPEVFGGVGFFVFDVFFIDPQDIVFGDRFDVFQIFGDVSRRAGIFIVAGQLKGLAENAGHAVIKLRFQSGFDTLHILICERICFESLEAFRYGSFDIIEISTGFITISTDDWLRLIEKVQKAGLKSKPEVGIQFGAGGASTAEALEAEGTLDPEWAIRQALRFLEAGAYMIMIESEGITENVKTWRTDVVARIVNTLGLEKVMFEAADPEVFAWYIKNYGPEVNLFVDHSQIVQLECLRSGIWGTKSLWGRVLTYNR